MMCVLPVFCIRRGTVCNHESAKSARNTLPLVSITCCHLLKFVGPNTVLAEVRASTLKMRLYPLLMPSEQLSARDPNRILMRNANATTYKKGRLFDTSNYVRVRIAT